MIEVAAGILLALVILFFLGSILRAALWLAVGAVLIVALIVLIALPTTLTAYFFLAMILGGVALLVLPWANSPKLAGSATSSSRRSTVQTPTATQVWLGDGKRVVTSAFGPFEVGDVIDHWQADYVRVFIGDLAFPPKVVADSSRPASGE